MPKYTPATIAKAGVAFIFTAISTATALAHGADFSALDLGEWLSALGAGLTAGGGVFIVPNKSTDPPVSAADQIVNSVESVIRAQVSATSDVERVTQALNSVAGSIPGLGPLAQQIIDLDYRPNN